MRAYLIDPVKRTITEVDHDGGLKSIYRLMGCNQVTSGSRPLNGSLSKGFDALYADDTDLLEPSEDRSLRDKWQDDPRDWYQVDADRNPPSSYPLSGMGLVVGTDEEGKDRDASIGLDELKKRITFTKRRFLGFTTKETSQGIVVTANVPIIDDGAA